MDQIDPKREIFKARLYRQHCIRIDEVHVKDLRIIKDREIEDMVIVDNSILSFAA